MAQRKKTGNSKTRRKAADKIIHVVFGPGGGRLPEPGRNAGRGEHSSATVRHNRHSDQDNRHSSRESYPASEPSADERSAAPKRAPSVKEPVTDVFTQSEIARLLNVSSGRLRTLDRPGIVSPSGRSLGRHAYTFAAQIPLRPAHTLLTPKLKLRHANGP